MKGRGIPYSTEEMAWLDENRGWPISQYHRFFVMFFERADVSAANLHSLRKRKGWSTGRTGRFEPGQVSWNKGKPCAPGTGGRHPNAQRTHFQRGVRQGVAVKLYKPIGTERHSKEGYLERKIHDGLPLQSRWRAVHLLRWEEINGPIPTGMCLKCLDGDRSNTDPANWEAIPRAILPRLNGGTRKQHLAFDEAEPAVRSALIAVAKLDHRRRATKRGSK